MSAEFWQRVQKTPTCWLWMHAPTKDGYGLFHNRYVHRVSYELTKGRIPEGMVVDHLCDNRLCVNPEHLQAVSRYLNIGRGTADQPNHRDSSSRFRNVYRHRKRWQAKVWKDGGYVHCQDFEDEEVAAAQVNVWCARYYPGFRAFNKVEMG